MKTYSLKFPDYILNHTVTLASGNVVSLLVDPTETYGHALARSGHTFNESDVVAMAHAGPLYYDACWAIETR